MTVAELIVELQKRPPELPVLYYGAKPIDLVRADTYGGMLYSNEGKEPCVMLGPSNWVTLD